MEVGRTYYVQAAASGSSTGRYTLTVVAFETDITDIDLTGSEPVTLTGTLGLREPGAGPSADVFRISPTEAGRLFATVHPQGVATRLSLLDDQGRRMIQSDGVSPSNPDDVIDQHLLAGTYFLKVESTGGEGAYTMTNSFAASLSPFSLSFPRVIPNAVETVQSGDFNADGIPDLVTNFGPTSTGISVLLGNGDGTFQNPKSVDLGFPTQSIVTGDFNGDGKLDMVLTVDWLGGFQNHGGLAVLLGKGDGTFRAPKPAAEGIHILPLVAGDFNNDGKLDVALVSDDVNTSNDMMVLLGNGNGTFKAPRRVATEIRTRTRQVQDDVGVGHFLVTGDFNDDGCLDLVYIYTNPNSPVGKIMEMLGNGDGTFEAPRIIDSGSSPYFNSIITGDFNGDDHLDLAESTSDNSGKVLLGNGDGTFQVLTLKSPAPIGLTLLTGDFNGDGHLDLASDGYGILAIHIGNGDGTFQPAARFALDATSLAAGDFNGDGRLDLATAGEGYDEETLLAPTVNLLLGNGDGEFQAVTGFALDAASLAAGGDFNGDGRLDLATWSWAISANKTTNISILIGNGDGMFQAPIRIPLPVSDINSLVVGDFNGDGRLDLATAGKTYEETGIVPTVNLLLGNGDGTFQVVTTLHPSGFALGCRW